MRSFFFAAQMHPVAAVSAYLLGYRVAHAPTAIRSASPPGALAQSTQPSGWSLRTRFSAIGVSFSPWCGSRMRSLVPRRSVGVLALGSQLPNYVLNRTVGGHVTFKPIHLGPRPVSTALDP
jgi:hypothetical protein